jgi:hypothetical protein
MTPPRTRGRSPKVFGDGLGGVVVPVEVHGVGGQDAVAGGLERLVLVKSEPSRAREQAVSPQECAGKARSLQSRLGKDTNLTSAERFYGPVSVPTRSSKSPKSKCPSPVRSNGSQGGA